MDFRLDDALALLARTPAALDALLRGLPEAWVRTTEGPGTWSAYDVVGHLVHAEEDDWMPRVHVLLDHGQAQPFAPFDRFGMFEKAQGRTLADLLDAFAARRAESLDVLRSLALGPDALARCGTHPAFGSVTLGQLIATWAVHDLGHLAQIARVLAHPYDAAVGPWKAYLSILTR